MTFIHGLASEKTCLFVADTLVTPLDGIPPNFGDLTSHILKIHVLEHDHAVAFAGSIAGAKIIERYHRGGRYGKEHLERHIEEYCTENLGTNVDDMEFLLFKELPQSQGIWIVREGKASLVDAAYLGNSEFYREMVTRRENLNLREIDKYYENMHERWLEHFETHRATADLINQRRFADVGTSGLPPIRIVKTAEEGFRFMDAAMKVSGEQRYSIVSVFSDNYPISYGYYFDAAEKGIVFRSGIAEPATVSGNTLDEFVVTANRSLSTDLKKRVH